MWDPKLLICHVTEEEQKRLHLKVKELYHEIINVAQRMITGRKMTLPAQRALLDELTMMAAAKILEMAVGAASAADTEIARELGKEAT